MLWNEIRAKWPDQWLLIEATQAHTDPSGRRVLNALVVVEYCADGRAAFNAYRKAHSAHQDREYYYVHTSREELDIFEERWLGVRAPLAARD